MRTSARSGVITNDSRNVPVNPSLRWLPHSPTSIEKIRYAVKSASGRTMTQRLPRHGGPHPKPPAHAPAASRCGGRWLLRPLETRSALGRRTGALGCRTLGRRTLNRRAGFAAPEPARNLLLLGLDEFLVVRRV